MDSTPVHAWFTIILVSIIVTIATKVARTRTVSQLARRGSPQPPVAKGAPLYGVLPAILSNSLPDVIYDQYSKLGSVFTLKSFGVQVTFLVGPEVSAHFFHGTGSEMSVADVYKITVPITGKGVGHGTHSDTRNQQNRLFAECLRPAKLRTYVEPMVRELEEYFAKWGQCGAVNLKHAVDNVLMLMASRCLLGKEVREHMHDEVCSLMLELIGGRHIVSMFYRDPHAFDPDRLGPGREEDRAGGELAYTSFGAGRHACMGEGYAYLQIKVILSHLLRNFELELASPFPATENMISLRPKGEVMVRYKIGGCCI